jgi:transglycosylase-like protein with SLT domain/D-alanyl-D-alanine carboxypeptidase-like protein
MSARSQRGQAAILVLGLCCALLLCTFLLFGLERALGAKGRHQRAADLAAMSAAATMRDLYPRLFEPPESPSHLSDAEYRAIATRVALRAVARNSVRARAGDVSFPGASFAPTRVRVGVRGTVTVSLGGKRREQVAVRARATAELSPDTSGSLPDSASGGGYHGPLAYRQGKPMRPDVARAFDRMAASARKEAGIALIVISGYRSDAEQAKLFAAHPDPKWVAPPGKSLHRLGTELDLGPPSAYGWLAANAKRFGFVKRYSWEAWHFGYIHNAGSASVGYGRGGGEEHAGLPSFVPARFQAPIARAAQRWNVGAALLAAQLYAESGFNPFARSGAGALGIAQFMPGTARGYGLGNPLDPVAAIDAQAHLMRDLLGRFGSVPLALAAYNAGSGAVARCMCVPFAETRAYVARILGLLGGADDMAAPTFTVRLVE